MKSIPTCLAVIAFAAALLSPALASGPKKQIEVESLSWGSPSSAQGAHGAGGGGGAGKVSVHDISLSPECANDQAKKMPADQRAKCKVAGKSAGAPARSGGAPALSETTVTKISQ